MDRLAPKSISDIFRSIFLISKRLPDGTFRCLLLGADPALCCANIPGLHVVRPGVFRVRWDAFTAKESVRLLQNFGYQVFLYQHARVLNWYSSFDSVPILSGEVEPDPLLEVLTFVPERTTFVELFGGNGFPLLAVRKPALVEVYNDWDQDVSSLFRLLRNPESFFWFFVLSRLFPFEDTLDRLAVRQYLHDMSMNVYEDALVRGFAWYSGFRQAYSSAWGADTVHAWSPEMQSANDALAAVDPLLPAIRDRIMRAQIERCTWQKILSIYDDEKAVFWVDPPPTSTDKFLGLCRELKLLTGAVAVFLEPKGINAHLLPVAHECLQEGWSIHNTERSTLFVKE